MDTIIAIGSNMGDRQGYIDRAIEMIGERVGRILKVSDVIETKAYGLEDQADFLNLAIEVDTELDPRQLLASLQGIEADLDRVRDIRWGPRTIDLDIIFYGDEIVDDDDLHIPHADFHNRKFVLGPLCRLDPDRVDPKTGKTVSLLLRELEDSRPAGARG